MRDEAGLPRLLRRVAVDYCIRHTHVLDLMHKLVAHDWRLAVGLGRALWKASTKVTCFPCAT